MNDDELRESLAHRAGTPLTNDERNDVLRAARLKALAPRQRVVPRLAGAVAGLAAVIVLVLIALPILLSPPQAVAPPTSSPHVGAVVVYSADRLSAMANDPNWKGQAVIAEATIQEYTGALSTPACAVGGSCLAGYMGQGSSRIIVDAGYRDAPEGKGTLFQTDSGARWQEKIAVPYGLSQVSAFLIESGAVDYLGPVQLGALSTPLASTDIPVESEKVPTDAVYAVAGWWWSGLWPNCPARPSQTPEPDLEFYCTGFWLTTTQPETTSTMEPPAGGFLLAGGEYPAWSDQHSPGAPVYGVYLIRSAGCQVTLDNRCPVWRTLGRLNDQSIAPTPAPAPVPAPTAVETGSIAAYSAQQLADKIGDSNWIGKTVLVDLPAGEIQHDPCSSPLGTPVNACNRGTLNSVDGPHTSVVVGVRDATSQDGTQYDADGSGYRWVKPLAWPDDAGIYAFVVGEDSVEYLGPVETAADGSPLAVADLAGDESQPSDNVDVVSGWLTHTYEAPCPDPLQDQETPRPNIWDYYCGGSWLTPTSESSSPAGIIFSDGLHVQNGAYDGFAVDPQPMPPGDEPVGYQPREATYLIRDAGCPELVTGGCPVWRMVGHLDEGSTSPLNSPAPAESPRSDNSPTITPEESVVVPPSASSGSLPLEQAIQMARQWVLSDAQVRSYSVGKLGDLIARAPGGSIPDSYLPDTQVWAIEFESTFEICPPLPPPSPATPSPCVSRPGLNIVFITAQTGDFVTNVGYSPNGPLPSPFFVVPAGASPST